ncbi:MAG: dTDP-4-dehydrorhamnose reductase [Pseudomonadota bacterium]
MNILLLGGSGQVGWELRRTLLPLGKIIAPNRAELDLADADAIRTSVRRIAPDLIVNAAAYTAVEQAESEIDLAMAINGTAPAILAKEAARLGAALVHYSTDYVFDGAQPTPYREDDTPRPLNVYGASKLAGEQAVQAASGSYLILRTGWVYGKRGHNFLRSIAARAAQPRIEAIEIVDDQYGAPTWCRLVAETTAAILAQGVAGSGCTDFLTRHRGIYHLAACGQTTWFGFAQKILRALAPECQPIPIPATQYPGKAKRPAYSVLACDKLEQRFGLALPTWESALELCLDES